jgi:branched-chain amino acid transport system permease protein/neutral amino acid transport system permease protein
MSGEWFNVGGSRLEKLIQLSLNGAMAGAILAVPAIGLTMIYAVLRFVNFSVAAHMAVGAYAGYMLNAWAGLPATVAVVGAFLAAGAVGIASDHVALRPLRGYSALTIAIASIALNLMIESAIRFFFGGSPRDFAIPLQRDWTFGFLHVGPQQVENAIIAVVAMALLFLFLALTLTGKAMRAVADNPMLADSKGIDPNRMAQLAVGLGMGLAGIGGMLVGLDTSVDPLVGFRAILSVFAAAVVGGLGSIPGAVVGGIAIGLSEELSLLALPANYKSVVGFLAIVIILTLRPQGLMGARA